RSRARGLGRPRFAQRRDRRLPRGAARGRARRTDAWCHRLTAGDTCSSRRAEASGSRIALPAAVIALAVAEPVFVAAAKARAVVRLVVLLVPVAALVPAIRAAVAAFAHRIEPAVVAAVVEARLVPIGVSLLPGHIEARACATACPGATAAAVPGAALVPRRTAAANHGVAVAVARFESPAELISIAIAAAVLRAIACVGTPVVALVGEPESIAAPQVEIGRAHV